MSNDGLISGWWQHALCQTAPRLWKRLIHLRSHRRDFPQQAMQQRGFADPKIGPLLSMQTHYAQRITLHFVNPCDAKRIFPDTTLTINSLEVIEGTRVYGDKCYGDWDICYIAAEFCKSSQR